jgi:hypothetical protein
MVAAWVIFSACCSCASWVLSAPSQLNAVDYLEVFGGSGCGLDAAEADLREELLRLELTETATAISPAVSAVILDSGWHADLSYKPSSFPVTKELMPKIISMPKLPEIDEIHIERVAAACLRT